MKPTPKKPVRPASKPAKKAAVGRRYWADFGYCDLAGNDAARLFSVCGLPFLKRRPVLVIDLSDAKAYEEAISLAGARARKEFFKSPREWTFEQLAQNVLESIGWPSPSVSAKHLKSGVRK